MTITLTKKTKQSKQNLPEVSLSELIEIDVKINDLKEQLKTLEKDRESVLKACVKAKKWHEGNWSLVRKTMTRRFLNDELLLEKFPVVYEECKRTTVNLTDVEKEMTAEDLETVITRKEYESYITVFDPSGSAAPKT